MFTKSVSCFRIDCWCVSEFILNSTERLKVLKLLIFRIWRATSRPSANRQCEWYVHIQIFVYKWKGFEKTNVRQGQTSQFSCIWTLVLQAPNEYMNSRISLLDVAAFTAARYRKRLCGGLQPHPGVVYLSLSLMQCPYLLLGLRRDLFPGTCPSSTAFPQFHFSSIVICFWQEMISKKEDGM